MIAKNTHNAGHKLYSVASYGNFQGKMVELGVFMNTKELVLKFFSENAGHRVSGEELAALCGVSRAAVWKAVSALRSEGLEIQATTGGGYIFKNETESFSKEYFFSFLASKINGLKIDNIEVFDVIDSTNSRCRRLLARSGNPCNLNGTFVFAESQSEGRGRFGRTFVSPEKTGVYFSVIYAPEKMNVESFEITAFSAVAVCRVLKRLYGIDVKIKWINDLFFEGKKICGILTEGFTNFETGNVECAVIGAGINLFSNDEAFKGELEEKAGFIFKSKTEKDQRCIVASEAAWEIFNIFNEESEKILNEYKELCFLMGKNITVTDVSKSTVKCQGKVVDIDRKFCLVVEKSSGERVSVNSGDVSVIL